ncbi:MAG: c-di-GMP-binding flagellar brake protein YcgR [Gammaproteobacteria bacterium]|jgi:c-di-GMP-binding flagellar brake protein YcgR
MTLQLQHLDDESAPRTSVQVLGYVPKRSVIVSAPRVNGQLQRVAEGTRYAVRVLQADHVLGFVCEVIGFSSRPYPHCHLAYPEVFESIKVRNAERASAEIPCKVSKIGAGDSAGKACTGKLLDLSTTGARVSCDIGDVETGETLQIGFLITVAGAQENVQVIGTVRSVTQPVTEGETGDESEDESITQAQVTPCMMGVQFTGIERLERLLLHAWVLER